MSAIVRNVRFQEGTAIEKKPSFYRGDTVIITGTIVGANSATTPVVKSTGKAFLPGIPRENAYELFSKDSSATPATASVASVNAVSSEFEVVINAAETAGLEDGTYVEFDVEITGQELDISGTPRDFTRSVSGAFVLVEDYTS